MKGFLKKAISVALAAFMCCSFAACTPADDPNKPIEEEEIDASRTQLFVYNFNGGYGSDWIAAVKRRYEELHKDDVYEEGKKGIQVHINSQKTGIDSLTNQILDNREEVYFTEYAFYYTLKAAGVLGDITEAVTADLSEYGDKSGSTIKGKMSLEQDNYYGITEDDGKTHYYGIPHYSGYSGLIYNVDLFKERGYYFVDSPAVTDPSAAVLEDYFVYNENDKKSAGPDGEYGTSDDGLPSTYEEFYMLCDYIAGEGNTPIVWTGANHNDYLNNFLQALVADYEGLDQMMLNYTLKGTATDLGTIINGAFVKDSNPTPISDANAYEIFRQAGKYYGLDFLEKIITTDRYHNNLAFNGAYSHMNAQEDFLYAGYDGTTAPIAMLCDGIWWEAEASNTFREMADSKGDGFSKSGRNFAFMPLPKASDKQNGGSTLFDHIYSLCFMKSNIAEWKKPIAIDFIKFANSDESLVEYTQITNTPKALKYEMTAEQMNDMSAFGRSVIELKQKSDVVYPYSENPVYINHQSSFSTHQMVQTKVGTISRQFFASAMVDDKISAEEYFAGMIEFGRSTWSSILS